MWTAQADAGHNRYRFEISPRCLILFEKGASQRDVGWPGDLDVALGSADDRDGKVESFDEARLIRSVVFILSCAFERFFQDLGPGLITGAADDQRGRRSPDGRAGWRGGEDHERMDRERKMRHRPWQI